MSTRAPARPAHEDLHDHSAAPFVLWTSPVSSWSLTWRGHEILLRPGDLVLTHDRFAHALHRPGDETLVRIELDRVVTATWLRGAFDLGGRRIAGDRGWGRTLSAFVSQVHSLPEDRRPRLLAEHLATLLALVESELCPLSSAAAEADRQTVASIEEAIRRCAQQHFLTAADVASALGISRRTLHRCLAANTTTFARVLIAERVAVARRMLDAHNLRSLTVGEIGRRAGFTDPSHFSRVMTRYLGCTPGRYRRHRAMGAPDLKQNGSETTSVDTTASNSASVLAATESW